MKKGISMIALAVYIIGFITIIGLLIAFNVNVLSKTNDFVARNTLSTEYVKFNMFFTPLIKNNNYIFADIDEKERNILKIINYGRVAETEYITDNITGEQYPAGRYWINSEAENVGYIIYHAPSRSIYYVKYDKENGVFDTSNPILISEYVSKAEFTVASDNKSVEVSLEYFGDGVEYAPNNITYIMGRGYSYEK